MPKVDGARLENVEELGDDGGDAAKVARPVARLGEEVEAAHVDERLRRPLLLGVHLPGARREEQVDARGGELGGVLLERARVARQVVRLSGHAARVTAEDVSCRWRRQAVPPC